LAAYGADRALAGNDTPKNRQRNRRIVFRLPGWAKLVAKSG
jgi:outer membrane protein OmpA-like peptidoglycan-associated protein